MWQHEIRRPSVWITHTRHWSRRGSHTTPTSHPAGASTLPDSRHVIFTWINRLAPNFKLSQVITVCLCLWYACVCLVCVGEVLGGEEWSAPRSRCAAIGYNDVVKRQCGSCRFFKLCISQVLSLCRSKRLCSRVGKHRQWTPFKHSTENIWSRGWKIAFDLSFKIVYRGTAVTVTAKF